MLTDYFMYTLGFKTMLLWRNCFVAITACTDFLFMAMVAISDYIQSSLCNIYAELGLLLLKSN